MSFSMKIAVFVQHVPGRPAWDKMREELEKSDVGTRYVLHTHPTGFSRQDNFLLLLRRMSVVPEEYVLRLEDDCSKINRHILHNLSTWPALQDARFGIGWGFKVGGGRKMQDKWHRGALHASLCTLFKKSDIPQIVQLVSGMSSPQDIAMSLAAAQMGKSICIHGPSLIENDIHIPSVSGSSGHTHHHTSCGSFDLNWKRNA